jgi:hypothetical protein
MNNPPTPLTPSEQAALDRFEHWVNGRDDPRARTAVIEHLIVENSSTMKPAVVRIFDGCYAAISL